jgi:serine/threonine protein kinase
MGWCGGTDTMGALMAGALGEAERAAIANHAASCAGCHALIEGLVDGDACGVPASVFDETQASGDGHTHAPLINPGARIGRYVLDERMGAGAMSVVYAAFDSELHRRVAVKLLRPDRHGSCSNGGRDRLMHEARSLGRLSHPNVVTVFEVGAHRGQLFIVMELVDGGNLRAWLGRVPRATDEVIDCMLGAGRGLAASHAAGVVHRDIKPDNILVGLDGRARVTDFGLARCSAALAVPDGAASVRILDAATVTRTDVLAGTPAYMAPEHLMRGESDARSDQWSFCATLYEALAGVRPFVIEDPAARSSAIAERRIAAPAPGRCVPDWVRQIVARGLRAVPSARWPSMEALVHALSQGAGSRTRPRRGHRPVRWRRASLSSSGCAHGGDHAAHFAMYERW